MVGDLWTLRILRTVFRGRRRHGDFVAELGISRAVLSDRLARLIEQEVLERVGEVGRHPEYRLTQRGLDLWSLFLAMWQWELDWGTARDHDSWASDRPRPLVLHVGCGREMRPELRCIACGHPALPFETRAMAHPGGVRLDEAAGAATGDADGSVSADPPASRLAVASLPAFRRGRDAGQGRAHGLAQVLGDRWSAALVAAAFRGARHFAQFRMQLGIGPAQLSERLASLQALGIMRARPYSGTRLEYRLTRAGVALFPMTLELLRWGNRWLAGPGEAYTVWHLRCHHELHVRWHCDQCDGMLTRETVRFG